MLQVDQKAQNLVCKVREIFMKYGIRSVSMDDISRDLGISKKTLYQHFHNKTDLVEHILETSFGEFESIVYSAISESQNAIDDLLEISRVIEMHFRSINPSIAFDLQKYYPDLLRINQEKKRQFAFRYIKQNIEKGIREDLYRKDLNIDLVARLYIQRIEDIHDPGYHDLEKITFDEIFEVMFENHIRGISNENGIRYFEEKKKTFKYIR